MSTFEPARLSLSSRLPLEIRVYDSDGHVVGRGFGSFADDQIAPGIYQVELRAGAASDQLLVRLAPGQNYERKDLSVPFSSAAPLPSTSNYHENHFYAAQQMAAAPMLQRGPNSCRLLLFARDVSRTRAGSFDRPFRWSLFDAQHNPVPGIEETTNWDAAGGCGGISLSLPPGGYILRTQNRDERDGLDQPIWLSDHWQTMIFLPIVSADQKVSERLRMAAASVHMSPSSEGWHPGYDDSSINLALAVEMCLPGLQAGRSLVPREQLMQMLNVKFQNPMFGIIGAYCMCSSWAARPTASRTRVRDDAALRDPDLLDTVLNNLAQMLGNDHPELTGVKYAAGSELYRGPLPRNIAWPPMVAIGYQRLAAAAEEEDAVVPESLAETAASWLETGAWTQWASRRTDAWSRRLQPQAAAPAQRSPQKQKIREIFQQALADLENAGGAAGDKPELLPIEDIYATPAEVPAEDASLATTLPREGDDMAETRLRHYLRELRDQDEESDPRALEANVVKLSSAMALPLRSVRRALNRVIANPGDILKRGL